jgi:hypothetical protein
MKYFKNIINFSTFKNLYESYCDIIEKYNLTEQIEQHNQICINAPEEYSKDPFYGAGSLVYDWSTVQTDADKFNVPLRNIPLKETDFTKICDIFLGTPFEILYKEISLRYKLGRVRIMKSKPKTCLTWHQDISQRLHYPFLTQEGCFMVVEDEVYHLPLNQWTMVDTTKMHTAFNGSKSQRLHIVADILDTNE